MLETLDPVKRVPAAPDDRERRISEASGGPWRAAGRADHEPASDNRGAMPWSGDWLQLGHELRTPLNAMLGNIELLLDGSAGPLAAPVRACIGDIQVASRQLLRQLQPLLLLVQARTCDPVAAGPSVDLLALVRQAAHSACGQDERARRDQDRMPHAEPCLPEGASLMMAGDPVWLGVLAAALVDLYAASPQTEPPLSIALEQPGAEPGEAPAPGAGGVVMRAFWPGLDPAAVSPLPLALIDAVLALHGARIRSLAVDGLRLDLPDASVVRRSMSARGRR